MLSSIVSFGSLLIIVQATSDYVKPWFCHKLDCPKFTVLQNTTDYQLRHYIPSKWVATNMTVKTYGRSSNGQLFQKLFQYISGNNVPGEKVEMTAPVVTTVIPESDGQTMYIMHFMIPYAKQTNTPVPNDSDVYLVDVPAMDVYVKSFGGFASESTYVTKLQELKTSLDTNASNVYDSSRFFTLGYDSPFAFINRHNEVWLQAVKA
ncbi:heme-binding protein 2-like [Mytilus californianus]|uniref:heme-binding protein 2-like n=1 Tax=Mytilus californianus TaxID=6549 RepID=UPI00224565F9|nr:heme-binding protein 2-like [Mytilus californianus]